jgi:glycosyltransferase involved in cell wall biosynthesis
MVITNTVKSHFYGSLAARLCGKPLVWRFHDILSPEDFHPLLIKLIVLFGKLFPRKVLAVSKMTKDSLIQNGFDEEKVDVIYNGIDVERFGGPVSKDMRLQLDPEGRATWVGCIGRIVPQKGQKIFLQSIPLVLKVYPGAFFLIIGDAFLKEEEYKEELLEIVRKNGIGEHVKFLGFRKDIRTLIQSLDVVVFPSVAPESFGLSIAEAMSLGKAVIASDIGGVGELVETGITGILVKPGDPEELADRIIYLLSHQEIRDRIGRKAKEGVNKTFPPEIYVRAMEKAFKETIGIQ